MLIVDTNDPPISLGLLFQVCPGGLVRSPVRGIDIVEGERRLIARVAYNEWEMKNIELLEVTAWVQAKIFLGNQLEMHVDNEAFIQSTLNSQ